MHWRFVVGLLTVLGSAKNCTKQEYTPYKERSTFRLHDLPYTYQDLEDSMWQQSLYFHHKKHHAATIKQLNAYVSSQTQYQDLLVEELLMKYAGEDVELQRWAGGHYNHMLFWWGLGPQDCLKDQPEGALGRAINSKWGTYEYFQGNFTTYSQAVFGSGWVWLCSNSDGSLRLAAVKDERSPLIGSECYPILGLDVWEHAYYLQYIQQREDYVDAFWHMVDWSLVEYFYEEFASKGEAVVV
jgi:Fe-Mn family superoxide dismutase